MVKENSENEIVAVLTSESDSTNAEYLAKKLLESRLAACVNFRVVNSLYWWEEELKNDSEVQLFIKTSKLKCKVLLEEISRLHSYNTPEIVYWTVSASKEYKEWIEMYVLN